ncbi:hypothetical protein V6N11_049648 [Hibiscus sabdariffa]|uniref:Uncharacterized protein n=2 Tax=Hibiscus sabdariffa TaxID=183260 RepID=A0ABR2ERM8_9ROSI
MGYHVEGHEAGSCGTKPEGETWPYQFGEWLRVPVTRKKTAPQGFRRSAIVYTKEGMGGIENSSVRGLTRQQVNQGD